MANTHCINTVKRSEFAYINHLWRHSVNIKLKREHSHHICFSNTQFKVRQQTLTVKLTTGSVIFIWASHWRFWLLFNLSSPSRLIWFLIALVCISAMKRLLQYLLTSSDAQAGSFSCFKYLQLFILANSCRQLLSGQHSQSNIMSGIRLHDHSVWEAVNDHAAETEKITACVQPRDFWFGNGILIFLICQLWVIFTASLTCSCLCRCCCGSSLICWDYWVFASSSVATGNKGASEHQRAGTLCSL